MMRLAARVGAIHTVIPLEVDKAAHDKLPDDQKKLYVEGEKGKFRLDVELPEHDDDGKAAKAALEQERTARKGVERQMKQLKEQFKGVDPEQFRKFMSHFEDEEDAELLKQGPAGIDKLVEKRMQKEREAHANEIAQLREQVEGGLEVASTFMDRVLDSHVISAAAKAGVHESAFDDVIRRARDVFQVDDEGNAVQFEGKGDPDDEDYEERVVMGKDGKNPFSPGEWIEEMKDKAPHWFPANASGGGASGNRNNAGGAKTLTRSRFESMPLEERNVRMKEGYKVVD
jgi:hypothetical protein